jgi:hypothetical protein
MAKVPFTDIGPVIRCSIERLQRPQEQQTEHHAGQTSHADLVIIQAQQPLEHPAPGRRVDGRHQAFKHQEKRQRNPDGVRHRRHPPWLR